MGRVLFMLALVLGIFLGGVWLFRNWQRFTIHRGHAPKLNVLETRSLGGRHAIYVVGYENERFLISSSPAGINMLTHLQPGDETSSEAKPVIAQPTFAVTLAQMLKGKQS
jgi:flagellar biogenesis protein FliO